MICVVGELLQYLFYFICSFKALTYMCRVCKCEFLVDDILFARAKSEMIGLEQWLRVGKSC